MFTPLRQPDALLRTRSPLALLLLLPLLLLALLIILPVLLIAGLLSLAGAPRRARRTGGGESRAAGPDAPGRLNVKVVTRDR